ncbi:septum formation initiator family protein [Filibacter tadaridae]|uniref:Cell division protein DivIC n=1 Tax=Filibacter tadaridae TaxID=2483811 RepID=A0A3P5WB91_9BACL|nr:septum formation initiator family protein [Filibacter tadaridae]VDC18880.1 Cell division protein DivIC [Filibacter tadaridae]
MEQKQQGKSSARVASIQTEYVRSLQKKESRKNARKARLYRRLAVFGILVAVVMGGLTHTFIKQKQALVDKEQQKVKLIAELDEVQKQQVVLKNQLIKLNDDDYIAKLARKEYFLSDENEIIFSVPDNIKKTDKKDDEKE